MQQIYCHDYLYFNPRTSCEVRHASIYGNAGIYNISIHAPRVRCDCYLLIDNALYVLISIHAPRVRCDSTYHKVHFYQVCLHVFREP